MNYSYSKFNPYNELKSTVIVDETCLTNSPLYLHIFENENSKRYSVITECIGIPLPYLLFNNCLVFGTSNYVYCYDIISTFIKYKVKLSSASQNIIKLDNRLIIICECDIIIVSTDSFEKLNEFGFNEVISDYHIYSKYMDIELIDGEKIHLDIINA